MSDNYNGFPYKMGFLQSFKQMPPEMMDTMVNDLGLKMPVSHLTAYRNLFKKTDYRYTIDELYMVDALYSQMTANDFKYSISSFYSKDDSIREAFADLMKKKGAFLLALLTKIFSFAFFYGSTFFILKAMGISADASDFFLILCATSFAITAVGFIPTPGASGGVEGSAGQVFKSIIIFIMGESIISSAAPIANGVMLIWRLLSYYFIMALSLIFTVINEIYFRRRAIREKSSSEKQ
jgi:uncharacterized membrane protein YbhN (UPF0104 family)